MRTTYNAAFVSLHVRKTNRAALGLYKDTLGFKVIKIEKSYCECLGVLETLGGAHFADELCDYRCGRRGEPRAKGPLRKLYADIPPFTGRVLDAAGSAMRQ